MQKFIIIILQSEIRCNNWDVSTVKNITNVSSYPIYTFKMAEEYRSFPPLFVLHSEKLWTVDVSNDTRRFEADIEASSLSATWARIEKTSSITFSEWFQKTGISVSPATQFPGCSPIVLVNQRATQKSVCIV